MAAPGIGDPAPDFSLDGTAGRFTLSEHRGGHVVLLFYPGDNTPVCTRQFCSYRDRSEEMAGLDAVVVGISGGDAASKASFTARHGLTVPLLADEDGAVAKAYGVRSRLGVTKRAVILVDAEGRIAHRHENPLSLTYDGVPELRAALEAVQRA